MTDITVTVRLTPSPGMPMTPSEGLDLVRACLAGWLTKPGDPTWMVYAPAESHADGPGVADGPSGGAGDSEGSERPCQTLDDVDGRPVCVRTYEQRPCADCPAVDATVARLRAEVRRLREQLQRTAHDRDEARAEVAELRRQLVAGVAEESRLRGELEAAHETAGQLRDARQQVEQWRARALAARSEAEQVRATLAAAAPDAVCAHAAEVTAGDLAHVIAYQLTLAR